MFLVMDDGAVFDMEHGFLCEYMDLLERQLYRLRSEADASDDPDAFGYLDHLEYLVLQRYFRANSGLLALRLQG